MNRPLIEILEDLIASKPTYEGHDGKWKCHYCSQVRDCAPDCVFKEAEDAVKEHQKHLKREVRTMMSSQEDIRWLLQRIKGRYEENALRVRPIPVDHRWIWQGCYDVWCCEQDRIDAVEIPKRRMEEAESLGLIESEKISIKQYEIVVWKLTDVGEEYLTKH